MAPSCALPGRRCSIPSLVLQAHFILKSSSLAQLLELLSLLAWQSPVLPSMTALILDAQCGQAFGSLESCDFAWDSRASKGNLTQA